MKKNLLKNFITKHKKLSFFLTAIFLILLLLWLRSVFFWNIYSNLYNSGGETWGY